MTTDTIAVTLLVDPASEASWRASRWLAIVVQARPVALELRLAPSDAGRAVARMAVAASDLVGPDGAPAVYEAFGRRRFVLGETESEAVEHALEDTSLPGFLTFAGGDTKWDAQLAEASEKPLIVNGVEHPLPELGEVPTGADATALFDPLVP